MLKRASDSGIQNLRKHFVSLTLKKRSKYTDEVKDQLWNLESTMIGPGSKALLEEGPTSNLEKSHFIIGHGILRPDIRLVIKYY